MKKILILSALSLLSFYHLAAQSQSSMKDLPYRRIPDYPEAFTPETTAARMIDGLGFRYYWATEGLKKEDLEYRPSDMARSSEETIDHIYALSKVIVNGTKQAANTGSEEAALNFEEKRKRTLENFHTASDILKSSSGKTLEDYNIIFQRGEHTSEFPFWNMINGPIADAIWHVGQVVSFRRASGNPWNRKANVFTGKVKE